ncbi:hypothetical protein BH20ACT14_BH20ACT14_13500 [soil metagenome]
MQLGLVPRHAPVQERNRQPFAGVAVSPSGTNDGNAAVQRGRQVIPARELRTVPLPETPIVSRYSDGAKSAETAAPGATVAMQVEAPVHAPLQRTSFAPGRGTAVMPNRVEVFQVVVQLCAQSRPGTSAVTPPGPEIVTVNGCWRSICTSQTESWESVKLPE